jgi:hypothetical protein
MTGGGCADGESGGGPGVGEGREGMGPVGQGGEGDVCAICLSSV